MDRKVRFGFVFLLLITYVYAETKFIGVGGKGGVLMFVPNNITAVKGDVIHWNFLGNHNVVQSDGLSACFPSQKANAFQSATNPPSKSFEYTVVDDAGTTIYYFCSFGNHCKDGMWGLINVVESTESQTAPASSPTNSPGSSTASTVISNNVIFSWHSWWVIISNLWLYVFIR